MGNTYSKGLIGYAFCGSFCTLGRALAQMKRLIEAGYDVIPIFSEKVAATDTRFELAEEFTKEAEEACGRAGIRDIVAAEPLGPAIVLDALILSPCTGNTLAKIASGISDGAVTLAAKAHLRADRPLLIALSSNDAMSQNLHNIATMLQRKAVYFLPMRQDNPEKKPHSLVAEYERMPEALDAALHGRQLRPLFV